MEEPKEKTPVDLSSLEAINNLDTARMALRWALERLQTLDKARTELSQKLEHESRMRSKAEEDYRAQQRTLSLRASEQDQRELYYRKLEELVTLRLSGQIDVPALLKREAQTEKMRQILDERQANLEKEYLARKESLELEYQRLSLETREGCREKERKAEQALQERRAAMDKEHVGKLTALREMDIRLKQQERALAEREARFEEFSMTQRAQLESDIKTFRQESEEQISLRLQSTERLLEERHLSLQQAWTREKGLLLEQLGQTQRAAEEQFSRILELERLGSEARQEAQRSESEAQKLMQERERAWDGEKGMLLEETAILRRRAEDQAQVLQEMHKRIAAAEQAAMQEQASAQRLEIRLKELSEAWNSEKDGLLGELRREQETVRRAGAAQLDAERRTGEAEENARQARAAAQRQNMRLEEFKRSWEQEKSMLLEELRGSQGKIQEQLAQLRVLEQLVITAEERARQAESEAQRRRMKFDELARAVEEQKEKETRPLIEELESARLRAQEAESRTRELQKKLLSAEERAVEAQAAAERASLLQGEKGKAWAQEKVLLAPRILILERAVSAGEEALRQAQVEIGRLGARLQSSQEVARNLEKRLVSCEEESRVAHDQLELSSMRLQEKERIEERERIQMQAQTARLSELEGMSLHDEDLRKREEKLQTLSKELAEEYKKKQTQIEELKSKLQREILEAVSRQEARWRSSGK